MNTREAYSAIIAIALPLWAQTHAKWGVSDCALATANIDMVVLGEDPAEPYRGRYRSERGAKRVLDKGGLIGAWAGAAKRLGWKRIAKDRFATALDGDRAVAKTPAGPTTVIRYKGRWFARADMGNLMVSDAQIVRAWSVC